MLQLASAAPIFAEMNAPIDTLGLTLALASSRQTKPMTAADLIQSLRPGQLLQATVLQPGLDGQARLRIAMAEVMARTTLTLIRGDRLTLQVARLGTTPELRVLRPSTDGEIRTAALRHWLPRQQPLGAVLEQTRSLLAAPPARQLPPELQQVARELLATVRPAQTLQAPQLRQAATQSGLWLESGLQHRGNAPAGDFKATLLRALVLLRTLIAREPMTTPASGTPATAAKATNAGYPAGAALPQPPATAPSASPAPAGGATRLLQDLLQLVEGALGRVTANQLASVPEDSQTKPVWQFELPLLGPDQRFTGLLVRFRQEQTSTPSEPETCWTATLNFAFEPLGPVQARITLRGDTVSSNFTAERPDTAAKLRRHLSVLSDRLRRAGLSVGNLSAGEGPTVEPKASLATGGELLREKA